jgi:hypothetical protein
MLDTSPHYFHGLKMPVPPCNRLPFYCVEEVKPGVLIVHDDNSRIHHSYLTLWETGWLDSAI